jgi:hypothetical protein
MKLLPLLFGIALTQIIPFDQTLPILTSPVIQARAGQELNYQYESKVLVLSQLIGCRVANFRNESCQATLSFQNSSFLPVSAVVIPKNCAGDQTARFRIPLSVPNGTAAVEWYVNLHRFRDACLSVKAMCWNSGNCC